MAQWAVERADAAGPARALEGLELAVARNSLEFPLQSVSSQPRPDVRIKVARLVTRVSFGGAERSACMLTALVDRRCFDSTLVIGRPEENEKENSALIEQWGVKPVYVPGLRRAVGPWDLPALLRVGRTLDRLKPNLIHTHHSKVGFLARMAALHTFPKTRRPKLLHSFHGHVLDGYFSPVANVLFTTIERILARFTDAIVTISDQLKAELAGKYRIAPREKIRVVRLGVDTDWSANLERHRGWLRQRLGVGPDMILVGIVGRLTAIKNHDLAIRAFARWQQQEKPHARLVIFGEGELSAQLEGQVQGLGMADRVTFAGFERDTAKIFSDLNLSLLTSHNEGTPVAIIESLASGVPAVCTRVGGVPDVMVEPMDGEIAPPGDEEAVARALAALAGRAKPLPLERVMRVRKDYSIAAMVRNIETLYREILGLEDSGGTYTVKSKD
jgi:glycosyltransferase involved in cell wall biosynthesis